ncbi:hypothetical protein HUG10_20780 (plasmid) [Halorarum halophilum]|uniref:Uncharacterized protein n=1 Tax=Halorarum halophilum TaxID=2743090 RepID=A0A7D5KW96_9EURY|nr:hypothetical protein [Halobaculum halophilum]QLG30040.1 hypothetical protein HUG10_20780 [Halobaculum halophilum]
MAPPQDGYVHDSGGVYQGPDGGRWMDRDVIIALQVEDGDDPIQAEKALDELIANGTLREDDSGQYVQMETTFAAFKNTVQLMGAAKIDSIKNRLAR